MSTKNGGETSEKRRSKTADEAKSGKAVGSCGSDGYFRIYALQMAKEGFEGKTALTVEVGNQEGQRWQRRDT